MKHSVKYFYLMNTNACNWLRSLTNNFRTVQVHFFFLLSHNKITSTQINISCPFRIYLVSSHVIRQILTVSRPLSQNKPILDDKDPHTLYLDPDRSACVHFAIMTGWLYITPDWLNSHNADGATEKWGKVIIIFC